MGENPAFEVKIKLLEGYVFQVDFGEFGNVIVDEPEPLGTGEGPNPARLLAAAVVNCLAASLMFAVRKYKEEPGEVKASVRGELTRVDGRWRIESLDVDIHLGNAAENIAHLDKALGQFEEFCIVTQSVRSGIDVNVAVYDASVNLFA